MINIRRRGDEDGEGQGPPAKQQRTGSPAAVYPKGSVKEVKMFNFMIYGEPAVIMKPCPRLNLVLGPNGNGKSTLICALCLGLGGSPKLLGRADSLKDYIRHGCDRSWVQTTLSGGPGRPDFVIRCEMSKTEDGYTSDWFINNASSTKKRVQDLGKSLNIQFDNLCQFLPQDKVVDFTRMDQHELLVATEKAVGDASLYEMHHALTQKEELVKGRQNAAGAIARRHEQLVVENEKLERDYERCRRRKTLQERLALMNKKKAWMGVHDLQDQAEAAAAEARQAQHAFSAAQAAANDDARPLKQRQQDAARAKQAAADLLQALGAKDQEAKTAAVKLAQEENALREARARQQGLQKEQAGDEATKDKLRADVAKVRAAIGNLPPMPDHTAETQQLQERLEDLEEQLVVLEAEKTQLMHERGGVLQEQIRIAEQLRDCNSVAGQRVRALMSWQRDMQGLGDAQSWVQQQRQGGAFRGEVVGPLAQEVQVKRGPHAERLAQHLEQASWRQLCSFACEFPEDEQLLMDHFQAQGVHSSAVTVHPSAAVPAGDAARFRDYGVMCTLDEVFDAPPLVKKALANTCGLHRTYCMAHDDTDMVKRLMEQHGVRNAFTTDSLVTYIPSSYGSREDAALKYTPLFPLRVLGNAAGVDDERKQQLQDQLGHMQHRLAQREQQLAAKQQQEGPLNQQMEALQQQKQQLAAEVTAARVKRQKLQQVLKLETARLAKLEAKADPLTQAPALQRKIAQTLAMHHAALTAQVEAVAMQWGLLQQQAVADMAWRELDMQAAAMQLALESRKVELARLQAAAKTAAAAASSVEDAFHRAREEAAADHAVDDEARQRFEQMPDDRQALQEQIDELELEVAGIHVSNPAVVQEFLNRRAEVEQLAQDLAARRAELDTMHAESQQLKEKWLPQLQEMVWKINTSFASLFAQIGCAGEVLLSQHEDYGKFSIQIKVKFREHQDLQLLTAHRQSGGERSASTILYLIALQGVTVTPFRVVDEINQGMDPANERRVFVQLVAASCQEGTPQCFLLSPKLLPDLPFTEDITILNVFNSSEQVARPLRHVDRRTLFGSAYKQLLQQVPAAG